MKSPGHHEHPEHKVLEKHLGQHVKVEVDGELVADSHDVVEVEEDGHPPRYYFPRGDVKVDKLMRTETTTRCPFKGTAHYYGVRTGERVVPDAVWTYEDPYEEHIGLRDRLAFWNGKVPGVVINFL